MSAPAEGSRRIVIVGIGDDGIDGLGTAARAAIADAQVLFGGARHLALVRDCLPGVTTHTVDLGADFAGAMAMLEEHSAERRVVLASGDPMLFGVGATLAARLGAARIAVLPYVSSVQLAFARLGEPLRDVEVLSAHGRELSPVLARAMSAVRMAILLDDANDACTVAQALLDAGMEDAQAAVCVHLTIDGGGEGRAERVVRGTLRSIAEGPHHPSLSLLVVLRDPDEAARHQRAAIPDAELSHRAGMITKAEVRALAVAALRLRPDSVLWDIGAGSGSVAVEAAMQLPRGRVLAVERDPDQHAHILANRIRFRVPQVELVPGAAPGALAELPTPDAVFIGGGGAELPAIIEATREALRPGGRLVLTLVALERLGPAIEALRDWSPEVTQVAIARGVPLAGATRFEALDPVWLIAATKPGGAG